MRRVSSMISLLHILIVICCTEACLGSMKITVEQINALEDNLNLTDLKWAKSQQSQVIDK